MKRINAAIIIATYCMLVLVPPAIHADCCVDRHDDDSLFGRASLLHPQAATGQQAFGWEGSVERALSAMTARETDRVGAADHCAGHQCNWRGFDAEDEGLTTRYSSGPQSSRCSLHKTLDTIDCTMGREKRFRSRDGPVVIPAAASLQTVVLLM